jgi:hypothetical protein
MILMRVGIVVSYDVPMRQPRRHYETTACGSDCVGRVTQTSKPSIT